MKQRSDKKIQQMIDEVPAKIIIIQRCGGTYYPSSWHRGELVNVGCMGGTCEVCGLPPSPPTYKLEPHEKEFRSAGGKLTVENSIMVCRVCHDIIQHYLTENQAIKLIMSRRNIAREKAERLHKSINYRQYRRKT